MKIYEIYERELNDYYRYVGWFESSKSAIRFCREQETQCIVVKSNNDHTMGTPFSINKPIIYKNY